MYSTTDTVDLDLHDVHGAVVDVSSLDAIVHERVALCHAAASIEQHIHSIDRIYTIVE